VRQHTRRLAVVVLAAAFGGVLADARGVPQEPPQQQPTEPPRFRVDANFVRVDAYPLRDGKPVLGLKAEDFEIFEDGAPQRIETFEHVIVRPAGPQDVRVDPGSQRDMLQAVSNPRNRVFVIFLDVPHVMVSSAHAINEPLIRLIDQILGPDDLVGVMTPEMSASQVVFGRKTAVIEESLRRNWPWGRRFSLQYDERENAYLNCYPPLSTEKRLVSALAQELITRKRERATLDALQDLVRYLRTLREERKAVLTVTEGWLLYGPNSNLTRLRKDAQTGWEEPVPKVDPVGVGPNGKLTTKDTRRIDAGSLTKNECDGDRQMLAMLDNEDFMRDIMAEANRSNASFYPIDPRGLPVFDAPIGPDPPPPVVVDSAMLKSRIETMRMLAENTDGLAVVDNNDLARGLRRIADDLTSYYLLGYHSSNTKLDGRHRSLKVRVKQPGVEVRARKGYRAASEAEVRTARAAADAPVPDVVRSTTAAIARLSRVRPDARLTIHAITAGKETLWVAGEVKPPVPGQPDDLAQGATMTIEVTGDGAGSGANTKLSLKPGERSFLTSINLPASASGSLDVRARMTPAGGVLPITDLVRLDRQQPGEPLLFRRGVTTGNRYLPAADFRFARTERVRIEIPVDSSAAGVKPGAGRLLDRSGQPLQVPVTTGERTDQATGQRWITADVTLAALSAGDYAVEISALGATEQRTIVAIRVTR
jgi:VWFA-related protein